MKLLTPIVSPKDFELVQRLITSRRNVQNKPRKFENIFAGLIKCADCGYAMTLAKAHRSPKEEIIDEYGYGSDIIGLNQKEPNSKGDAEFSPVLILS